MRIREYPGFLPGLVISIVIALALSGRVARWLGIARPIAWGLLFGLGIIVAATLTPGGGHVTVTGMPVPQGPHHIDD